MEAVAGFGLFLAILLVVYAVIALFEGTWAPESVRDWFTIKYLGLKNPAEKYKVTVQVVRRGNGYSGYNWSYTVVTPGGALLTAKGYDVGSKKSVERAAIQHARRTIIENRPESYDPKVKEFTL